jgi:phosphoribosylformylglycinamidine synthase
MSVERQRHDLGIYRFIVCPITLNDPRSADYLADAHALGLSALKQIRCQDLFFIEGCLENTEADFLAARLLSDPLTQKIAWARLDKPAAPGSFPEPGLHLVEVALRPGVTDPVAEQIVRAAHILGIQGVQRASTGQRFVIQGQGIDENLLHQLANRLLSNSTIQRFSIGEIEPAFPHPVSANAKVDQIPVRKMAEDDLLNLSQERRAALDLEEMRAIQRYFQSENRDMTDIEFETIAQTWSEHCGHKTFKACITIQNPGEDVPNDVNNLLKTYLRAATEKINAPWVRSAFVDNAGIIDFDDQYEVSFKVETHNHPSAIEPFGGANTGVGGVIRDVIGVSAKPIAATDVLCFGLPNTDFEDLPAGVLHPRRIRSGVVSGVQDYGNKIGLPTVSGAILYDPGFAANPLVFCGCVGIAPKDSHPRAPQPGDRVIVLGGGTGRDGLRGATFSSMTMDAQTGEVAGASVQIGAPIVEKGLIDVILQARDSGLYHAITDCGAGGLSSAVGEMANPLGAEVDLMHVRLKYPGLAPWEIWLSEAQERMVLAVPGCALPQLQALCDTLDVSLTDIGCFSGTGRLVVRYGQDVVLNMTNAFLHDGIPQRKLLAVLPSVSVELPIQVNGTDYAQVLTNLLSHPNIASKAPVIRIYDHEVQGGTVIKPLTGAQNDGPSDAVVLKPNGTVGKTAMVLSAGINPEYGKYNVYQMTLSVIDEAIRNAVATGANPQRIALLDNFCWANPKDPQVMGELVESARGCYDAACYYGTPFISGKDSLNNEYLGKDNLRHAIPPTLLISAIGIIPDLACTVTMDLKQPGDLLYLVGDFKPRLGGSHFHLLTGIDGGDDVPGLPEHAVELYRALYSTIQQNLIHACHDLSEGGLAVSAAEMGIGGRLGLDLDVGDPADFTRVLFGETNGCLLVEVAPDNVERFERSLAGLPVQKLGLVTKEPSLIVRTGSQVIIHSSIEQLVQAWQTPN